MITIVLLVIIYIAFISLGLPDGIMGVSWPAMRIDFDLPLDQIGIISLVVTVSTVLSSILSGYIINKIGTGLVTIISVFFTAAALLGISLMPSFWWLLLFAFPLGFGAGSIDTALNNYVALHYKAIHMNWLHSFWGVGATLGPIIMSFTLLNSGWRNGFKTIAIIQFVFFGILLISLPLWKKAGIAKDEIEEPQNTKPSKLLRIKGVPFAISVFIVYCAIEFSVGIWGSSYLVGAKDMRVVSAAKVIAFYYGGITIGRFISGLLTFKFNNRQMIYIGIFVVFIGALLINFKLSETLQLISFGIIGLGLSPIFPAMIHETPTSFGKQNSQYIIGYQMAGAYIGSSIFPPLFGLVAGRTTIAIFPYYILGLGILLLIIVNALFLRIKNKDLL